MAPSAPSHIIRDLALMPMLGSLFTMALYGATCMQTYQYYHEYPQDSKKLKFVVAVVFLLESIHAMTTCHYLVYYHIEHYGQVEALLKIVWSVWVTALVGFNIALVVNMFFVRRIYVLSNRNLWLSIFIGTLASLRPAFGYVVVVMANLYPEWRVYKQHAQWLMIAGLSLGLGVDCVIAFCVSYFLLRGRNQMFGPTRGTVDLLVKYTLNTGGILTLFALVELIGLVVLDKSLAFLGLFQIQVQLYANCFLTNLNTRQSIRREANTPLVNLSSSGMRFTQSLTTNPQMSRIAVKTETSVITDAERRPSLGSIELSPEGGNPAANRSVEKLPEAV